MVHIDEIKEWYDNCKFQDLEDVRRAIKDVIPILFAAIDAEKPKPCICSNIEDLQCAIDYMKSDKHKLETKLELAEYRCKQLELANTRATLLEQTAQDSKSCAFCVKLDQLISNVCSIHTCGADKVNFQFDADRFYGKG